MRLRGIVLSLVLVGGGGAACVRVFPALDVPEPPAALERHTLCAAVEEEADWARPRGERPTYSREGDPAVYSFLTFRNLRESHLVLWRWYDPSGRLIREAEPVPIGRPGRIFESYIAWDRIALGPERPPGAWTVAVFVDGQLADSRTFTVR